MRCFSPDRGSGSSTAGQRLASCAMSAPSRARVRRIRDRLRELYGRPFAPPHGHGLDELILTVLSQSTNDRNRDVAFLALRRDFADWAAVRDAPNADVERSIRPGGISQGQVRPDPGDPARDRHRRRSTSTSRASPSTQARDELVALPGVGRKTAACVLLFAYGMRDIPVDTHVSPRRHAPRPVPRGRAVRGAARRDARAHAARAGARVPREPAPPRPPDVSFKAP